MRQARESRTEKNPARKDCFHGCSSGRCAAYARRLVILLIGMILLAFIVSMETLPHASAQLPPIFPSPPLPFGDDQAQKAGPEIGIDDRERPKIEVLTTHLNQGKNVLIVEITDASYLKSRQVKYVEDGRIALSDLARDHDNIYYALVNVKPPSSVLEIEVIDLAGNRATVVKEIPVGPPLGFFDYVGRVLTFLDNAISTLGRMIGIPGR